MKKTKEEIKKEFTQNYKRWRTFCGLMEKYPKATLSRLQLILLLIDNNIEF